MGNVLRSRGLSLDEANNELSQLLKATDHTETPVENKTVRMLRDQVESVRAIRRAESIKGDESPIAGVQTECNTHSKLLCNGTQIDDEILVETVDAQCQTFTTESPELMLIRKLFNMMDNLNQALHSFIQESRSEYTCLRDELQCIKNKVKFESRNAEENISNFEHTAEKIENAIQLSINSTQKKFQSICDLLKASTSKQPSPSAVFGKSQQPSPSAVSGQQPEPPKNTSDINRQSTPRITRKNTLIIGDSILRGIHTRGLSDLTTVKTLRGKRIRDVCAYLRSGETADISKVVIYIGGNDVAQNACDLHFEIDELKQTIQELNRNQCKVFICTVAPRRDCNVRELNANLQRLEKQVSVTLIESHDAFIYGNRTVAKSLYHNDGIHLNVRGTRTLINVIHAVTPIIRAQQQTPLSRQDHHGSYRPAYNRNARGHFNTKRCTNCGLSNHVREDCRRAIDKTRYYERRHLASYSSDHRRNSNH